MWQASPWPGAKLACLPECPRNSSDAPGVAAWIGPVVPERCHKSDCHWAGRHPKKRHLRSFYGWIVFFCSPETNLISRRMYSIHRFRTRAALREDTSDLCNFTDKSPQIISSTEKHPPTNWGWFQCISISISHFKKHGTSLHLSSKFVSQAVKISQVTSLWPVDLMAALGALARQHQASEMALLMLGLNQRKGKMGK